MNIDDVAKLGLGGLGLWMLYSLLKPLISSLIASQEKFVATLAEFSKTLEGIVSTVDSMRDEMRTHAVADVGQAEKILRGEACRYDPRARHDDHGAKP